MSRCESCSTRLPGYRPLIATALYTGMRPSELTGLTWEGVDFDQPSPAEERCLTPRAVRAAGRRTGRVSLVRRVALGTFGNDV
jgi:integrase